MVNRSIQLVLVNTSEVAHREGVWLALRQVTVASS